MGRFCDHRCYTNRNHHTYSTAMLIHTSSTIILATSLNRHRRTMPDAYETLLVPSKISFMQRSTQIFLTQQITLHLRIYFHQKIIDLCKHVQTLFNSPSLQTQSHSIFYLTFRCRIKIIFLAHALTFESLPTALTNQNIMIL